MQTVDHQAGVLLAPATHDSEAEPPDLVIPLRAGEANQQLRWALRSYAANMPHGRIWVVGGKPTWLRNVHHLPTRQTTSKYRNTTLAMRAACEHPDVSDPFIYTNDDIFAMQPIRFLPVYHRGKVADLERYYARKVSGAYLRGMRETRALLARLGYPDPYSYEVHAPMVIDKAQMLEALELGAQLAVVHKRSLYGNLAGIRGMRIPDPKVLSRGGRFPRDSQWLSTMSDTFNYGEVGKFIRAAFPHASPYEAAGSQPPTTATPARRRPQRRIAARGRR